MPTNTFSDASQDGADQIRSAAADIGHAAADKVDAGGARVAGFAHGAADKLSSTADYIRAHDVGAMLDDVKALVKKNPVPAMLGAAVLGFVIAKAFSSRE
jgi:hypothetical protein